MKQFTRIPIREEDLNVFPDINLLNIVDDIQKFMERERGIKIGDLFTYDYLHSAKHVFLGITVYNSITNNVLLWIRIKSLNLDNSTLLLKSDNELRGIVVDDNTLKKSLELDSFMFFINRSMIWLK